VLIQEIDPNDTKQASRDTKQAFTWFGRDPTVDHFSERSSSLRVPAVRPEASTHHSGLAMPKSKVFLLCPLGLLTIFACTPDTPNQASTAPLLGGAGTQCRAECAITTDSRPFEASHSSPDSATGWLFLADVTLTGTRGATISLGITADQHLVAALPRNAQILVNVDGVEDSFTVSELVSSPVAVYRFEAATTVHLRYALSRGTPTSIPVGDFRLTQYASLADVASSDRRWIAVPRSYAADLSTMSSCVITVSFSKICGIYAWGYPFVAGGLGGTFQSNSGTGASRPITITFSAPGASSITVTIHDPTWPGNSAQAYDAAGNWLGSVGFNGTGVPGWNLPETQTLPYADIRRLDLIPADADYVSYDASFAEVSTPPACKSGALTSYNGISSEFAHTDPMWHTEPHKGRDYLVPDGTEVYAPDSGTIVWRQMTGSAGYAIVLRSALPDSRGLMLDSYFMHLQGPAAGIEYHSVVHSGQLIAYSDNSGTKANGNPSTSNPHLHFGQNQQANWPWADDPTSPFPGGSAPVATVVVPCTF
jgi:Peptidase family M23